MHPLLRCAAFALFVACSDTSGLPTEQNSQVDRSAKLSMDGATVIPAQVVITFSDPSTSLAVLIGVGAEVTPADVCNGTFTSVGKLAPVVFTPSGGVLAGAGGGHNVPVEVFEFPGPEITDFCQLEGKALVATGTASFSAPTLFTPGGVETGTWVVRGTVDLVSGGQDRLFGKAQLVVRPDGSLVLEKEQLTLTPL